jgi:hypothetical protein
MLFSLVILALPVGVIGGTFSQVWQEFEQEKKKLEASRKREMESITSAIQRIDPSTMNKLLIIELWNERFARDRNAWGITRETRARPAAAEFMGQAWVELELDPIHPTTHRYTVPLREDMETVDRAITGNITIECEWQPTQPGSNGEAPLATKDEDTFEPLHGNLKVTLVQGEKLVNLDLCGPHSASNPYCTVLCYPNSPKYIGEVLWPVIWRGPTRNSTLNPKWHASHVFEVAWTKPKEELSETGNQVGLAPRADCAKDIDSIKLEKFVSILQDMGSSLGEVQDQIRILSGRVDRMTANAAH